MFHERQLSRRQFNRSVLPEMSKANLKAIPKTNFANVGKVLRRKWLKLFPELERTGQETVRIDYFYESGKWSPHHFEKGSF